MERIELERFQVLADGLDHPEGVAVGPDGAIYAGGEAGQIYQISPHGGVTQIASTQGFVLGLCLDAAGNVYACDQQRHAVVRVHPDGSTCTYASGTPERPMRVPNFPVFAADGTLYVSDSGTWDEHDGCVWQVGPDGTCTVLDADLASFPNGLALSGDGRHLYCVLSNGPSVVRVALTQATTARVDTVVELPGHVPDGIALDADGGLWIACYAPDVLLRHHAGVLERIAYDPRRVVLASPTNVAFCGAQRRTLLVGSLARWHVATAPVAVAGQPLNYPRI